MKRLCKKHLLPQNSLKQPLLNRKRKSKKVLLPLKFPTMKRKLRKRKLARRRIRKREELPPRKKLLRRKVKRK